MASGTAQHSHKPATPPSPGGERFGVLDALRGFSAVSMVLFHACYDLVYIAGVDVSFFHPPLQDIWRASISWTFLLIAGISCRLTRSNLARSARYLALAAALFAVTSIAAVDTPISFGIIFCMGASTLAYALLERAGAAPDGMLAAACLAIAFACCLDVPSGRLGLFGASVSLGRAPYESGLLSWLGFPGPGFASGDYYPLLPYSLLFMAGAAAGPAVVSWLGRHREKLPRLRALEAIGRRPLEIYVAHQPVLLLIINLATRP